MFDFEVRRLSEMAQQLGRRIERLETQDRPAAGTAGGGGTASFDDTAGDPADVGTVAADGASTWAARLDHVHAFPRTLMFSDAAGNPADVGTAASDGVSTWAARADHVHAYTPAGGNSFSDAQGDPAAVGMAAAADGTSVYAARRDHVHPIAGTVRAQAISGVTGYSLQFETIGGALLGALSSRGIQVGTVEPLYSSDGLVLITEAVAGTSSVTLKDGTVGVRGATVSFSDAAGTPIFLADTGGFAVLPSSTGTASMVVGGTALATGDARIEIGNGRTAAGLAFFDLIGGTVYTNYGARFVRDGEESTILLHRGTADMLFNAQDAGAMAFRTTNSERMRINATGEVGIGTTAGTAKLRVAGGVQVGGDQGGVAGYVSFTNGTAAVSTGSGTIKMNSATGRNSTGWLKVYNGTVPGYVPWFQTI
jgi:hypothetical protein